MNARLVLASVFVVAGCSSDTAVDGDPWGLASDTPTDEGGDTGPMPEERGHGCLDGCATDQQCVGGRCVEECAADCGDSACDYNTHECVVGTACANAGGTFAHSEGCNGSYTGCDDGVRYTFKCAGDSASGVVNCDCFKDGESVASFEWNAFVCTGCDIEGVLAKNCGFTLTPTPFGTESCRIPPSGD